MMDLTVRIGSLTLKNPIIAASGCFGYGVEYADVVDLSTLGAIVSKGLFLKPREGHPAIVRAREAQIQGRELGWPGSCMRGEIRRT